MFSLESYLLYNFILLGVCVFSYLAEHLNKKTYRYIARFIVFLFLFIPAALRYKTGTDYDNYIKMFNSPTSLSNHEFFWQLLNSFIHYFNLNVQWLFVFSAILIYFPLCFGLRREHYCISITLYVLLTFYFKSYNILRQMIAVSFCLCAMTKYEDKKYIKSLIYILIAYGFHSSAILYIPCLIICSLNIKNKYFPTVLLIFLLLLILKFDFMGFSLNILATLGIKYAKYLRRLFYQGQTKIGTGLGIIANLLFSISSVFLYSRIKRNNPEKKVALNLSIIYICSYYLAAQYIIMGRLRDLFIISPLFISGNTVNATGKYKKVVCIMLIGLNLLMFEKSIASNNRNNYSNSIYPYYSIFYKGDIK